MFISWPHIHIAINHFPIVGVFYIILALIVALVWENEAFYRVVCGFMVIVALTGIPVFITGQLSEDVLPDIVRVPEIGHYLEFHETLATSSFMLLELLGFGALLAALKPAVKRGVLIAMLPATMILAGLMVYTAEIGSTIRHTEARPDPLSHWMTPWEDSL